MDAVAFATWLVGVRCLDASQRGRAFQKLVLAEEHDTGRGSDPGYTRNVESLGWRGSGHFRCNP